MIILLCARFQHRCRCIATQTSRENAAVPLPAPRHPEAAPDAGNCPRPAVISYTSGFGNVHGSLVTLSFQPDGAGHRVSRRSWRRVTHLYITATSATTTNCNTGVSPTSISPPLPLPPLTAAPSTVKQQDGSNRCSSASSSSWSRRQERNRL